MNNPMGQYQHRKNKHYELAKKQNSVVNSISQLRLIVFLVGMGISIYLYWIQKYYLSSVAFVVVVCLFIYLIKKHQDAKQKHKFYLTMSTINEDAIKRITGKWTDFDDKGEEFIDDEHNYSQDLDIFGQGSLFQWTNSAKTFWGRNKLKEALVNPDKSKDQIHKRQQSIDEMAKKLDWRQKFLAEGLMVLGEMHDPEDLCSWAEVGDEFYRKNHVVIGFKILPILTAAAIVLNILSIIPYYVPVLAVILHMLLLLYRGKERSRVFETAYKYRSNLRVYTKLFDTFEKEVFKKDYLRNLQKGLKNKQGKTAHSQIGQLEKIVDSIANRNNQFYIIINILLLSDYKNISKLERWKQSSGENLRKWFNILAEVEALSSLSNVRYDHPDWVFPTIIEDKHGILAKNMGHPLLSNRVCNDLIIAKPYSLLMITGSNMSGKSTLLRTVGINLALAYSGTSVCASEFQCSILDVHTSMRTRDNLEKNLSSFYAELLRISKIVSASERASKEGSQVLVLLDEIFKGTNSADRHTGARILLKKLSREGAFGLVSTHDLELGDLEHEQKLGIRNYNFREYYKDGEIFFDYKLRYGVSTTKNAIYLMKMVGIDVNKEQNE
ncbi:MAG: hypothetical protein APF76_16235 [Desulfitibacter sp. BRH_c19]|nr:MAG: hypothetical protein APF76_16235 [Desulfitibacter sp. BRH_c19]